MQTHANREYSRTTRSETQGPKDTFQFVDQRLAATSQNRLDSLAAASPQTAQLQAIQAIADASSDVETTRRLGAGQTAMAQRQAEEDEEPLQGKFAAAQREAVEDEEPVQGKFATVQRAAAEEDELQMKAVGASEPSIQFQAAAAPHKNDTGLPDNLKSGVESLSGMSMDNVRVHYNSSKPAQLNAYAYAQGTDIHVGPGQEKHLPHEAWHVVQQAQGRVKPTMQMKDGVPVNDDAGLEGEADLMGRKALSAHETAQFRSNCGLSPMSPIISVRNMPATAGEGATIQGKLEFGTDFEDNHLSSTFGVATAAGVCRRRKALNSIIDRSQLKTENQAIVNPQTITGGDYTFEVTPMVGVLSAVPAHDPPQKTDTITVSSSHTPTLKGYKDNSTYKITHLQSPGVLVNAAIGQEWFDVNHGAAHDALTMSISVQGKTRSTVKSRLDIIKTALKDKHQANKLATTENAGKIVLTYAMAGLALADYPNLDTWLASIGKFKIACRLANYEKILLL